MAPKNTSEAESIMSSPHHMSLREQAAMRASAAQEDGQRYHHTPQTPIASPHPLANSVETPESLAHSARKEWRQHGSGITQELEEKRRLDEARAGTVTVRVLSAETRRDVAGKKYTAYVLRVQLPSGQVLQIEHRYSDFAKLAEILKDHHISLDTSFPSKHWAGRLGNWTPSLKWAPEQHQELIDFRKIQFDVWLVHVVEKYNLGDLPHSVAHAVYEFLTVPDRPPCDEENNLSEYDYKWNNPLSFTLGSSIRQATGTLRHMCNGKSLNDSDQSIPLDLLQCAKGLCFLTVIKGGLVVSGRVGTGLLITKLDDRWSAPCALGTVGLGWGMLAGGDITHYLVVLTTHEAVESLISGTVQLGAELGVAVGPVGRGATSHVSASNHKWEVHPAYAYAHSQGLFVGISLEGSVLTTRHDVNSKFYGRQVTPDQVLNFPAPKAADPLYRELERALATAIPEDAFRPSQLWKQDTDKPLSRPAPKVTTSLIHAIPIIDTMPITPGSMQ
jgi:lipid-binding SYLF domain-containing protein